MTTIVKLISSAAAAIAGWFGWRSSPVYQRREAEKDLKKEEEKTAEMKAEISTAIHAGDDDKINRILAKILPLILGAFLTVFLLGCNTSKTVIKYVPADRKIESCTNSLGIACKAVPDIVFEELLHAVIERDDLRREMKLEKRLSK